jgi:ATP-dependent DNA helicase RecG
MDNYTGVNMRTTEEICNLLNELENCRAVDLEDQDLDFKEWNSRSMKDSVALVVEMAICMVNGGGGTVVFGVNDKEIGRAQAVLGVPPEVDVNRLKKAVYDSTDPKLTPVFEEIFVPEGSGRLLVMQVYPGIPPYTDTTGKGKVRIGTDCQPLTGTLRRKIMVETGETDFTAEPVPGKATQLLSSNALEKLRDISRAEHAPDYLLQLADRELMRTLGLERNGMLTKGVLLLGGTEKALRRYIPGYNWTFLKMVTDIEYENRSDHSWAIPASIVRLEELILPFNPITTVQHGMFHFEYRTYPEVALREALMNAFCHADFRIAGPIMVKLYPDRIEISNNGGFIGGITPYNILHHHPAARNPLLVDALARLRLVNRSNLGVCRMYQAFLMEGKAVPSIEEVGESVRVTLRSSDITPKFRSFIAEKAGKGRLFNVDELLVLNHLLRNPEINTGAAARLCQRTETDIRPVLVRLEQEGLLEHGGSGRGTYWAMRPDVYKSLSGEGHPERDRRIDWEAAKTRILSVLIERARRGEPGLSNKEIRQIIHFDRNQARRLMLELMKENPKVAQEGERRWARYAYSM